MMNKRWFRLSALVLALVMLFAAVPAVRAEEGTLTISTAEEFLEFAKSCTLDSWSRGKTVRLTADISLANTGFTPIPTFGGTFEGDSHTITGLEITDTVAPAGLFARLQADAVVRNLNLEGSVCPDGEKTDVGGLAGVNSGTVENCTFTGTVSGKRNVGGLVGRNLGTVKNATASGAVFGTNSTGGLVGCNLGLVQDSRNKMYVNIESTDPGVNLDELSLNFSLDLSMLSQIDTANVATDTGGVAGYSSGTVDNCVNYGAIGHQHIGYNVGGVVGRSSGAVKNCSNEGSVCGRKDVGSIVGQMEPYVQVALSESTRSKLQRQLDELSKLVDQASDDAEGGAGGVSSRLNSLSGYVDTAVDEAGEVKVNADVNTNINGSGNTSSDTNVSGDPKVDVNPTPEGGTSVSVSGSVDIDHTGEGSGTIDASTNIVASPDLGGLSSAVNGISGQIALLNSAVAGTVGTLAEDVRQINAKFSELSDTLFEAMDQVENGDIITDTSALDIDSITLGKVSYCTNRGAVSGDINAGGVAGSMGQEYTADPEDDVSGDLSGEYRRQYEYKAVIQLCENDGVVTGKRSYVGGIVGRMDLGFLTGCRGFGSVESEGGDYVGGIAGLTAATVRDSYAKATLKGGKYVGGIVGSGVEETASGSSSTVTGCYSMVEIPEGGQYQGAVSGSEKGTFAENHFVSDTLAGINRQSIAGEAEPMTYAQLSQVMGLPQAMQSFTLTFVADDVTLFSDSFSYGASFGSDIFPQIPAKDGYYARWDREDLTDLHFDTVVTAVYTPYVPGLASQETRENGRSVFLLEGDYDEHSAMTAAPEAVTATELTTEDLADYFSKGGFPAMVIDREVVEQWKITFTDDGRSEHTLRYLAPSGKTSNLRLYVEDNGGWVRADYDTIGSYLVFPVTGSTVHLAVVTTFAVWWIWLLAFVALAAVIITILVLVRKNHKRKPILNDLPPEEDDEPAEEKEEALTAEERLARAEAELEALRSGKVTLPQQPKKKKRWWIPVLIVVLVAALGVGAYVLLTGNLGKGLEAYRLLNAYVQKDPMSLSLGLDTDLNGVDLHTDAQIRSTKVDGKQITMVESSGVKLYYADGNVYLDNGKAYAVGKADYSVIMDQAVELYKLLDVDKTKSGSKTRYTITASGSDAAKFLDLLGDPAEGVNKLELVLTATDGSLTTLEFSGSSNSGSLSGKAILNTGTRTAPVIPDAVLDAISDGTSESKNTITDDVLRLLEAWATLENQESYSADIALRADCGPIVVNDTLEYDRLRSEGDTLGCVRKGSVAVYFSGDTLCDSTGRAISTGKAMADSAKLIDLAYTMMASGTVTAQQSGDIWTYTLALDQEGMKQLSAAIAPDVESQNVTFTTGNLTLTLTDGTITALNISCSGTARIVLTDTNVSLGAGITFVDREVSFPEAVRSALKK